MDFGIDFGIFSFNITVSEFWFSCILGSLTILLTLFGLYGLFSGKLPFIGKHKLIGLWARIGGFTLIICGILSFLTTIYLPALQTPQPPTEEQLITLVNTTVHDVVLAIKTEDFSYFYKNISTAWKAETTPQNFLNQFEDIINSNIDLTVLLNQNQPIFHRKPRLNEDKLLVLHLHYPTESFITYFELKYILEDTEWKLVSIIIDADPISNNTQTPIPSEAELNKLVRATIKDFSLSIQAKEFTIFYKNIATVWQQQTTPDAILEIFYLFIDSGMDLTVLNQLQPVFQKKPYLNDEGVLALKGYYPTESFISYFELKYIYEDTEWKLINIFFQNDIINPNSANIIPPVAELNSITNNSMNSFDEAVAALDFTNFHQSISVLLQAETTPDAFLETFGGFSTLNMERPFSSFEQPEPIFNVPPYINDENHLVLKGYYPTQPVFTYFDFEYIHEDDTWKLIALYFGIDQTSADLHKTVPSSTELESLTNTTMNNFALAIDKQDFSDFHTTIASVWQLHITPAEFLDAFKVIIDKNINLTPINQYQPIFNVKPYINSEGRLILIGHYSLESFIVYFELNYIYEDPAWKLTDITVFVG